MLDSELSSLVGVGLGAEKMEVGQAEDSVDKIFGGLSADSLSSRFVSTTTPLTSMTDIARLRTIRDYLDQWSG